MILDFVIIFVGSAVIGAALGFFSALLFKLGAQAQYSRDKNRRKGCHRHRQTSVLSQESCGLTIPDFIFLRRLPADLVAARHAELLNHTESHGPKLELAIFLASGLNLASARMRQAR